jgi:phage terminase large subunit-like protein
MSEHSQELSDTLELMETVDRHKTQNKMLYYEPAEKHKAFFAASKEKREVMFAAGNGVGKSESGTFEDACHLTGDYPDWWPGVRFPHPVNMWIASETGVLSRDVVQSKLCGPYGVVSAFGTGMIPKNRFADKPTLARGVTDAFDTIQVIHKTNGIEDGVSTCQFKSFEQGREKFQGENLHFGHADEEPPMDIYSEFLARIRASDLSRMIVTFTPLHGRTDLYARFDEPHPDRALIKMSLDEATWYSEEQKRKMIEGYPAHERDARRYGVPLLGSGRIFLYDEASFTVPYLDYVPAHWVKIWGVDFGVGHPFAAVLLLWDRDNDVIYVLNCIRLKGDERNPINSQPMFHAAQMKAYGAAVPVAWPHDGNAREKGGANATIASLYKAQGLKMLPTHATFPDGGYSTEAGIKEMDERLASGRLKVCAQNVQWFEEYRFYHRKDGLIVKINDDLLSATRQGIMAKRFAKPVQLGNFVLGNAGKSGMAIGAGDNPLDWR